MAVGILSQKKAIYVVSAEMLVAMEHIQGISSLAEHIHVPVEDLLVPCVFCGNFLDLRDLLDFDKKCLQLTWKKGFPHGTCSKCAREVSEKECKLFTEAVLTASGFFCEIDGGLSGVNVRCRLCLKLLNLGEKEEAVSRGERFFRVRRRWRARCRACIKSDNDWEGCHT
ncbi:E6 [Canis familiaris papillomavirus 15]|uniref:Protein E6 n=1 Tax=Canis familiaris papillomavirus 15 TaxID=1272519 RepID=L0CK42_9PAPI|nr:E6 [Canis familiaris papillomavirus 15]